MQVQLSAFSGLPLLLAPLRSTQCAARFVPDYAIGVYGLETADRGFYQTPAIDYSHVPDAPQNLLAAGGQLDLSTSGGTLRLNFDGAGGGTWTFIYEDGQTPNDSGSITGSTQTNSTISYPVIPESGAYINDSGTYARFLSVRQITIFLDGTAGPNNLTAIQPEISFHKANSGWFDGGTNPASFFRGQFTYTAP